MSVIRVGVQGATGYTALELIRLLLRHPNVEITAVTSRSETCPLAEVHPSLTGRIDLRFENLSAEELAERADVCFCCLPHVASMESIPSLLSAGLRVIDLSADYRLRDPAVYEQWYGHVHTDPTRLGSTVYGLPELYGDRIAGANLIANPGCYTSASILALAPALCGWGRGESVTSERAPLMGEGLDNLKQTAPGGLRGSLVTSYRSTLAQRRTHASEQTAPGGLIEARGIIIDAKSGVSGAGRTPKLGTLYCECNESVAAYSVGNHRHTPEIEQVLSDVSAQDVQVIFTPHLVPMDRGILATIYAVPTQARTESELLNLYRSFYEGRPFVRIVEHLPRTKDVAGTNFCDITIRVVRGKVLILAVLDNLIKGAAGVAVQNFNLLCGFDETTALL